MLHHVHFVVVEKYFHKNSNSVKILMVQNYALARLSDIVALGKNWQKS